MSAIIADIKKQLADIDDNKVNMLTIHKSMKVIEDNARLIQRIVEAEINPTEANAELRSFGKYTTSKDIEEMQHALNVALAAFETAIYSGR